MNVFVTNNHIHKFIGSISKVELSREFNLTEDNVLCHVYWNKNIELLECVFLSFSSEKPDHGIPHAERSFTATLRDSRRNIRKNVRKYVNGYFENIFECRGKNVQT